MMKRREFITLLGGVAAWPLAASAQQQGNRVRRIGMLGTGDENPVAKSRITQAFADLGWTDRNVRMDFRWADITRIRAVARQLVGSQPDIIFTGGTPGDRCRPAGDADDPDRLYTRGRPRRQRHRPAARPPGWEHHRLRQIRTHVGRQVA
jgi:hypothetical protein